MSSDDFKPRSEPSKPFAGPGSTWSMRCGKCNQPMRNYGRRQQRVNGLMVMVGACCQKVPA